MIKFTIEFEMWPRRRNLTELLSDCLETGDLKSWEALVVQLMPLVAGVAARSASRWRRIHPELVEDLTQEAFFKLCKDRFAILRRLRDKPEGMIVAFIKVTVANVVHDYFRAERAEKRNPEAGLLSTADIDNQLSDQSAEDTLQRGLLLAEVDRVLCRKLSGATADRDRRIFWLHHRHGMTAKAIAGIPGIELSEKGVESTLFRLSVMVKEELVESKGISTRDAYL